MEKQLSALAAASFAAFAWFAAPAVQAHSQMDRIAEVTVIHGKQTLIKFKGIYLHSCGSSPYFILSEGDNVSEQRKQMLAIALAAVAAGKGVFVVTGKSADDEVACSANGYEWVQQLSIIA